MIGEGQQSQALHFRHSHSSYCLLENLYWRLRLNGRQKHRNHSPTPAGFRAALHANRSVVLVHDALADPQAQTSTNIFLCCEEGFKEALANFCRNTWAGIGNGDSCSGQWPIVIVSPAARDSNANVAASLNRIDTVAQEIRNDLPDFTRDGVDLGVLQNFRANFHPLVATTRSKDSNERIQERADGYSDWALRVPVKAKRLLGHMRDAVQLFFGVGKKLAHILANSPLFCEIEKVHNSFKRIVDFVGDGGGEPSNRR